MMPTRDRGNEVAHRPAVHACPSTYSAPERQHERDERAGDRRGARPAVGLDDVAVDPDRPLAEELAVHRRREASGRSGAGSPSSGRPACRAPPRARRDSVVARGSIPYSAVTQPLPLRYRNGGTFSCTEAVQMTRVSPTSMSTEPSACLMKFGVIDDRPELVRVASVSVSVALRTRLLPEPAPNLLFDFDALRDDDDAGVGDGEPLAVQPRGRSRSSCSAGSRTPLSMMARRIFAVPADFDAVDQDRLVDVGEAS